MQLIRVAIVLILIGASYAGLAAYCHAYFSSFLPPVAKIDPAVEEKRLAEEEKRRLKEEEDKKLKDEKEKTDKEEAERKRQADAEKRRMEEEVRQRQAATERKSREEAARQKKLEEERKKKEEDDRKRLKGNLLVLAVPTRELSSLDEAMRKELLELKSQLGDKLLGQQFFLSRPGGAEPVEWDPAKPFPSPADDISLTVRLNDAMLGLDRITKRVDPGSGNFRVIVLLWSNDDPDESPVGDKVNTPSPSMRSVHLAWVGDYAETPSSLRRMLGWFPRKVFQFESIKRPGALVERVLPLVAE